MFTKTKAIQQLGVFIQENERLLSYLMEDFFWEVWHILRLISVAYHHLTPNTAEIRQVAVGQQYLFVTEEVEKGRGGAEEMSSL